MNQYGLCPRQLQFCHACKGGNEHLKGRLVSNPEGSLYEGRWCKTLECPVCYLRWQICTQCPHSRAHLKDSSSLRRHFRDAHIEDYNGYTSYQRRAQGNLKKVEIRVPQIAENILTPSKTPTEVIRQDTDDNSTDFVLLGEDDNDYEEQKELEILEDNEGEEPDCDEGSETDPDLGSETYESDPDLGSELDTDFELQDMDKGVVNVEFNTVDLQFDTKASVNYFAAETRQVGSGARRLLANSFFRGTGMTGGEITEEDVEICLQMTLLVQSMNSRQNKLFTNFLDLLLRKNDLIQQEDYKQRSKCPNCQCDHCTGSKTIRKTSLPPLPRTIARIRGVISNGKNAMIPNLARPMIREVGRHVYVLPSECIRLYLANGHLPMRFDNSCVPQLYGAPNCTPRGVYICSRIANESGTEYTLPHVPLSYLEWRDDCEPSKSNKLSKKGSLWVWTITIFESNKGPDSVRATFPIAIGYKSDDHNEVEHIIGEDMRRMSDNRLTAIIGARVGRPAQQVTFSAEVFLSLGDQPERRGANQLMAGSAAAHATSHGRWRLACDHSKIKSVVPACKDCVEVMELANSNPMIAWKRADCTECTNWMIVSLDSPLLQYKPRPGFPTGFLLGAQPSTTETNKISPMELTYEKLISVVNLTHKKLEMGEWNSTTAAAYLKDNAINESYTKVVVKHGMDCCIFREAFENAEDEWEEWLRFDDKNSQDPSKYKRAAYPALWQRGVPLVAFVDTPMHLLFLGVAKAIFVYIGIWAARCQKRTAIREIGMQRLTKLEALKLSWLSFNVQSFDRWGGWVSEKYQSLARVALWVYGPMLELDEIPVFVEPPGKEPKDWFIEDYRKWLAVRGLPIEGSKTFLKDKVLEYLALPLQERPPILPPAYGSADSVMKMVRNMVVMFTTIMQPTVQQEQVDLMTLRIRLFLSSVEEFDIPLRKKTQRETTEKKTKDMKKKRKDSVTKKDNPTEPGSKKRKKTHVEKDNLTEKGDDDKLDEILGSISDQSNNERLPLWCSMYNFLSLLNLPDMISEFGSPRNYFEGKYLGEKFVKEVKNAKLRCPPRNTLQTLMKKLHEEKALESMAQVQSKNILTYRCTESTNNMDPKKRSLVGNVVVYRSLQRVREEFVSNRAISLIMTENGDYGALYYENGRNRGNIFCVEVRRVDSVHFEKYGMRYWRWALMPHTYSFTECDIQDFVVLLPHVTSTDGWEYSMVTKNWSPAMLENYAYSLVGISQQEDDKSLYVANI